MAESIDWDMEKASPHSSSVLGPEDKNRRKHSSADLSGSVFLISGDGRLLKLPIPSQSPRDPLGWSNGKRLGVFLAMLYFGIISLFAQQVPGLLRLSLSKEFDTPEELGPFSLESLSSFPTLFMGIGAIFWIPVSLAIGRRPVVLASTFFFTMSMVWAVLSRSFYSLLGSVCLAGFSTGVSMSTGLLVVIDITFIHERPQAIAAMFCVGGTVTSTALSLLPLVGDYTINWRPFYGIWILPAIAAIVLVFFFVPETYFLRPPVAFDGRILIQTGAERIRIYEDPPCRLEQTAKPPVPVSGFRPLLASLKVFVATGGDWKSAMACYPQMLLCLANPLIFWVAAMNAVNFGGMMSIGITFPELLGSAPYNLPSSSISLVNLAAAIGALVAWPGSAVIINRITKRLATRSGGVRHAEYLLPGYILPVLTGAASVFIYGVVAEHHYHYFWVYLAYGFNCFSYISMSVANTLWVTEAFPYWAAAALAVVGGLSYIASFAISSVIHHWVDAQGYFWVNIEIGIALLVLGFVSVPMAFWGKSIRQYIHGRWGIYEAGALRPQ